MPDKYLRRREAQAIADRYGVGLHLFRKIMATVPRYYPCGGTRALYRQSEIEAAFKPVPK